MAVRFSLLVCLALAACRPPGYRKGGGDDDGTPDAGVRDAAIDGAAATCEHGFRLDGHGSASTVLLTGTFTMWGGDVAHGGIPFALGGDSWTLTHTFDVGVHQYKFVIDGTSWIADPTNPNSIDDGFGGKNSLYTCAP